jgi:hypothetical protein
VKLDSVEDYIRADLVHSIHTSERRSFRGCRRRHDWIFRHRYYPTVTPTPLEFGVAYHAAMEKYYEPRTWNNHRSTAREIALQTFVQTTKDQRVKYTELNGEPSPELEQEYKDRVELGLGMLKYYMDDVSPRLDRGFWPVKVEVPFEVPISSPDGELIWCKCNLCFGEMKKYWVAQKCDEDDIFKILAPNWKGLPVTYGGRIDMLAEDENGYYWVFDWKTAARLSGVDQGTEDDFLLLDDQITSYCWAMRLLGLPVKGFVYHEQKKAFPQEPEPLARLYKGRRFSSNKQFPTTADIYRRTVSENDPVGYQAGAYDEHISYLTENGFRFESRRQIPRNETELDQAGYNIWLEAQDIVDPQLRIYPSSGRFSCSFCAFQQPCLGKNRGEDYQYTLDTMYEKRNRHYFQVQPLSTDKPGRG